MEYLSHFLEKNQTKIIEKYDVFFAFSEKQLEEGIQKILNISFEKFKELGNKLVNLGHGSLMIIRKGEVSKEKFELYFNEMEKNYNEAVTLHHQAYGAPAIIRQAYFNYECQISMDPSDAYDSLSTYKELYPEEYSDEVCSKIFKECFSEAVKNDWF